MKAAKSAHRINQLKLIADLQLKKHLNRQKDIKITALAGSANK